MQIYVWAPDQEASIPRIIRMRYKNVKALATRALVIKNCQGQRKSFQQPFQEAGLAYRKPVAKMPATLSFRDRGIWRLNTIGRGRQKTAMSTAMFMAA